MRDAEVSKLIYDVYSKKWKGGGVVGTLTSNGNASFTHCGTFFVVVERKDDDGRKILMDKAGD